jgi:predicted permease
MVKWGRIREKGKQKFVVKFSFGISMPLVFDYYLIKFLLNSSSMVIDISELLIVWMICLIVGFIFSLFGWTRMEKDWHEKNYSHGK